MKILLSLAFLLFSTIAYASPQGGITPCVITSQPADLSFSGTSANRQLSTCGETLIVYNNSTSDLRFRLGSSSTTTAVLTDMLIPSKSFLTLNVGTSGLYIAIISSGTGVASFIQGNIGN